MSHTAAVPSIRRRLLGMLLAALVVAWVAAAGLTYLDAHREADRLLDAHLAQAASLLVAQTGHELLEIDTDDLFDIGPYGQGVTFQIWEKGRGLILKSADGPGLRFGRGDSGFSDSTLAGRRWRVFTAWSQNHDLLIEVAEDHHVRERIAARVALNTLTPLAFALPVLALLGWCSVSRALRPLVDLGEQIRVREPRSLTPLNLARTPREALPLIERMNELFARIRRSLELERRFTGDAAHELRTPVAAARAQAEVARDTADDPTRTHALNQVIAACDRMATLLEQLLILARLDQSDAGAQALPLDLAAVAREAVAEALTATPDSRVQVEFTTSGATLIAGNAPLLAVLVRNLLTNALRHARSHVHIEISGHDQSVELHVSDDGPGVPATDLSHLGERFFRGGETGPGSGLGLSIVRRIAEVHGARVEFGCDTAGGGLTVRLRFGRTERETAGGKLD